MIKFLRTAKIDSQKKIFLLRLDLNETNDWKLKRSLPTIKWLLKRGKKIVILSHKGRPIKYDKSLSLKKDAVLFRKLLKRKVIFLGNFNFPEIKETINYSPAGSIFLLENLRFFPEEQKNSPELAKKLAELGDFYVNDAFAVCHRTNTSVSAITDFLPSFAGLELESEIKKLSQIMTKPSRPFLVILGGAKISTKLPIFRYFQKKADIFLVGGALANNFLAASDKKIGKSLVEKEKIPEAKKILKNGKVVIPIDVKTNKKGVILDIGPKTVKLFVEHIKKAKTIIWNGPMGKFEDKIFRKGTEEIAKAILNNKKAKIIIGGGETISSLPLKLKTKNLKPNIFISTGGGAMLEFLSGKKLPGIVAIKNKDKSHLNRCLDRRY